LFFLLLLFLSVRIYYRIKLLKLSIIIFSYIIVEKSFVGIFRVLIISGVIICFINVFISLVFRVTFEFIQFKLVVYLFIFMFLCLRVLTNWNFKFFSYGKMANFKEIWRVNFYVLDKFLFWNVFRLISSVSVISRVKLFLLINWW